MCNQAIKLALPYTHSTSNDTPNRDQIFNKIKINNSDIVDIISMYKSDIEQRGQSLRERASTLATYAKKLFFEESKLTNFLFRLEKIRKTSKSNAAKWPLLDESVDICNDGLSKIKHALDDIRSKSEEIAAYGKMAVSRRTAPNFRRNKKSFRYQKVHARRRKEKFNLPWDTVSG